MSVVNQSVPLLILGLILSLPSKALALDDTALCARAQEVYGVTPERCVMPSAPAPKTTTGLSEEMLESHIFFPQGGADLNDDAQVQIAVLLSVLDTTAMQNACLRLIGHSDSSGGGAANKALAQKRADTVANALRSGLKDPTRLRDVLSEGEAVPLQGIPTTSPLNRRVEIQAKTCPPKDV